LNSPRAGNFFTTCLFLELHETQKARLAGQRSTKAD
jgi:hypothetical protein